MNFHLFNIIYKFITKMRCIQRFVFFKRKKNYTLYSANKNNVYNVIDVHFNECNSKRNAEIMQLRLLRA